ncbi:MAG: GntP family permease [Phycisphaerae bacterium]|nr:GntP family permease [Phycisphaerae bacterium]
MWLIICLLLSVVFIIVATTKLRLHPFLALLIAAFGYGVLCRRMSLGDVVQSVNGGFGSTIGHIGIVILAGSVIGTFLEKSGGALALARSIIKTVGQKNVPLAMSIVGYIVSIPVFCDSGFVILCPLAKALSRKAKVSLAASAVALSLGLYATHTMVPPTPGPIAAADLLNADLGRVIMLGLLVSVVALTAGWLFAITVAAKVQLDGGATLEKPSSNEIPDQGPSALKSVVPILLPIVLIVLKSVGDLEIQPFGAGRFYALVAFVGEPVVALLLGVFAAFFLPKRISTEMLSTRGWVGEAVIAAATIIVITGCGGAFGKVLQNSGIGDVVGGNLGKAASLSIWLPFIIAAALKTAQGSSTVAIVTTAGIMAPLLSGLGLDAPTARALVVVAIGAGAMVVSHANDSYFWVVTGLCKMSVKDGYRLQTLGTLVEGGVAAVTVWIVSLIAL